LELIKNFDHILQTAKERNAGQKSSVISVAAAHDKHVIEAAAVAKKQGIADFILVGDSYKIREYLKEENALPEQFEIIEEKDPEIACTKATSLVAEGKAAALMKGIIDTSMIMKAALNKETGIRTGKKIEPLCCI
jgi:phosphate butyryltransferase